MRSRFNFIVMKWGHPVRSPKLAPALANYAKEYPSLPITVKGYKK